MRIHLIVFLVLLSACSSQLLKYEDKDFETHKEYQNEVQVIEIAPTPTPAPSAKEKKISNAPVKKEVKPVVKKNSASQDKYYPSLKPGQEFSILISYLGMTAGELIFSVKNPVTVNGKKAHHFFIEAKTLKIFEMVYKVNNKVTMYSDYNSLMPFSYELDVQETKKVRQARAVFDPDEKQVKYWEKLYSKKDGLKKIEEVWPLQTNAQSAFSAQYYLRTLDFSDKQPKELWISHNKENLRVVVSVLREEKVKTKFGEFDCVVVKPTLYLNDKEKKMGDVVYWITKDERKIIVKLDAKIKIGSLKGELHSLTF